MKLKRERSVCIQIHPKSARRSTDEISLSRRAKRRNSECYKVAQPPLASSKWEISVCADIASVITRSRGKIFNRWDKRPLIWINHLDGFICLNFKIAIRKLIIRNKKSVCVRAVYSVFTIRNSIISNNNIGSI